MSAPPPGGIDADPIVVARIVRPQGLRGEVIAELLTDFPERFKVLDAVRVVRPGGEALTLKLERCWPHKGRMVLKFAGYDTIERAEELRDARLTVSREQLVRLPENTFYDFDLVGCEVTTSGGERLGHVAEIHRYGATPLLAVRGEGREHLIPLALDICTEIDVARKRIIVEPPEGLLDL